VIRQRINLRTPALAYAVRVLTLLLGLALLWYGLMVVLLAVKVSPHTVNSLSAYRTLYDKAAGIRGSDFTTPVRLIAGFGGLLAFLFFVYLALQEIPRPYLARGDVALDERGQGSTIVRPRAIERVVTGASGRMGDNELNVNIGVRRASTAADTLTDVRKRVAAALDHHQLPQLPVNVTVAGYDRTTTRELS
jgi:hypothetical protein